MNTIRNLTITSSAGDTVTGRLAVAEPAGPVAVMLAHGAGAGQDHPWMVSVRDGLAAGGCTTLTFDYAYTAAGRKSPDRMPRLLDVHRAALEAMRQESDAIVLAGKSMGGRMASHLVGDDDGDGSVGDVVAMVYYGYPLVPLGKGEPRPTDHLRRITVPQLFFAGTRDRLGPPPMIEEVVASLPAADLVVVDDGDHSFKVPKRAGRSDDEVRAAIVADTISWLQRVTGGHGGGW